VQRLGFLDWRFRPLQEIALADNTTRTNDLVLKAALSYRIHPSLTASVQYQYEGQSTIIRNLQNESSYAVRNLVNRFSVRNTSTGQFTYPFPVGSILSLTNPGLTVHYLRAQLNFARQFGKHHSVNAIAGAEARESRTETYTFTAYGYNPEYGTATTNINYQASMPVNPSGSMAIPAGSAAVPATVNRFISYYTNAGYIFKNRYAISASARRDGANLFGVNTNQQFRPLWSAGIGWTISREPFYRLSWLPQLKLRATYGLSGNAFTSSALLTARFSTSTLTGVPVASVTSAPNPDLRWEKVSNVNIGVDFAMPGPILSGSVEYYIKKGMDLVEAAPLAPSTGFSSFSGNAAMTRTNGWDFNLHGNILSGIIGWQADLQAATVKDKVLKFDTRYTPASLVNTYGSLIAMEGRPLFGIYAYQWNGLDPATGDPQGWLNGKPSKDYAGIISGTSPDSLYFGGPARPSFFGSLRNTFSWKGFSLSFNISWKTGYVFRRYSVAADYVSALSAPGIHQDYYNRWQKPGDEQVTDVPSLSYPVNTNRSNFYKYSSALIERGDHIRWQDIRLSYTPSQSKALRRYVSRLELFAYATNLGLIWRANKRGIDPDFNGTNFSVGFPEPFNLNFGLRATLR
jgi:outer membrane receptor protein involved in Fe transport